MVVSISQTAFFVIFPAWHLSLQGYCIPFIYLHSQFLYFLSYNCTTSSLCDLPNLKKEEPVSYRILACTYQTTWCDTPGDCNINAVKPQLYIAVKAAYNSRKSREV